jgi:hypothetical protein
MLLIYSADDDQPHRSEDELKAMYSEYFRLGDDLRAQGRLISAEELAAATSATTVQVRDDDVLVTDGPFAETKETLGGYYLIEADTLDEAIEWAARIPAARDGKVEIRPVHDNSGYRE